MTTLEGNKLIAEFMGRKIIGNWDQLIEADKMIISNMKYNSSWNALMPVVEKIEDLGNIFTISQTYCNIQEDKHNVSITGVKYGKTKMEAVYQAVIQFITWYNQQGTKINR